MVTSARMVCKSPDVRTRSMRPGRLVNIGSPSRNLMAISNSVLDIWHPFELEGTWRNAEAA